MRLTAWTTGSRPLDVRVFMQEDVVSILSLFHVQMLDFTRSGDIFCVVSAKASA